MARPLCILVIEIRPTTPNEKGSAGERGIVCKTWTRNVSVGLQESRGEILCRDCIQIIAWSLGAVNITSKEKQLAGGGGTRGKCMSISKKW